MAIHDMKETRVRVATERASEYLRAAGARAIESFDVDTMTIRLLNGDFPTVVSDAVNLLQVKHETTLSESERLDLSFVLGIVFGAALHRNGSLDEHLDLLGESLGDQLREMP